MKDATHDNDANHKRDWGHDDHAAVAIAAFAETPIVAISQFGSFITVQAQAPAGQRKSRTVRQMMTDVQGRQVIARLAERDPGNGGGAHPACQI
jgi:hypothetical protein